MDLSDLLRRRRLLAVVDADDPAPALASVVALVEAGVSAIEIPLTAPRALDVLVRVRAECATEVLLGAGRVLTEADVVSVEQAGVDFVVTPALVPAVAEAVRIGLPALVGALTPAEVVAVSLAGAGAVKLFPASIGGPDYLRTLRQTFPEVSFVPHDGVDLDSVPDYLDAGALAVAVGPALLGDAPAGGDLGALRRRAALFRSALG